MLFINHDDLCMCDKHDTTIYTDWLTSTKRPGIIYKLRWQTVQPCIQLAILRGHLIKNTNGPRAAYGWRIRSTAHVVARLASRTGNASVTSSNERDCAGAQAQSLVGDPFAAEYYATKVNVIPLGRSHARHQSYTDIGIIIYCDKGHMAANM